MSDAIAMSSPNGRMSKRARKAAEQRLSLALFGPNYDLRGTRPEQTTEQKVERLLQRAKEMRGFVAYGWKPRVHLKEAIRLEVEAKDLIA